MPVRPTLLHRIALVSFLLFRKNLDNLGEFFGQMVYRPPRQKIARTPMIISIRAWPTTIVADSKEITETKVMHSPFPSSMGPLSIVKKEHIIYNAVEMVFQVGAFSDAAVFGIACPILIRFDFTWVIFSPREHYHTGFY